MHMDDVFTDPNIPNMVLECPLQMNTNMSALFQEPWPSLLEKVVGGVVARVSVGWVNKEMGATVALPTVATTS